MSASPDDMAAIESALLRYTRGIDRLDADLVTSAFHDDAVLEDYGPDPLPVSAFVDRTLAALRERFSATQHRVSNIAIEVRGDVAVMESYVLAYHVQPGDDASVLHTFAGRYVDRCERRDGEWRIAHRWLRNDWSMVEPIERPMGTHWAASARDHSDPVYTAFD